MKVYRTVAIIVSLAASLPLYSAYVSHASHAELVSGPEATACGPSEKLSSDGGLAHTEGIGELDAVHELDNQLADADSSRFVEQEIENLVSPFTKETVLTLNSIVARSLSAIEEFDEARKQFVSGDDVLVVEAMKVYRSLSARAASARNDMGAERDRLLSSDERYNEAIFAAMVHFVEQVDEEIRQEIQYLQNMAPGQAG